MKIALCIAYDGTHYSGWQRQSDTRETIQEKMESALSYVADHPVTLYCAGRTDAGVHALTQVAHFETRSERLLYNWQRGANTRLPDDINVRKAYKVSDDFHARYSAVRRAYTYIIDNTRVSRLSLNRNRTGWVYEHLDMDKMAQAAKALHGEHDFSAFRAANCQAKTPVKTVYQLDVYRRGDCIHLNVMANAFLHHMVRNIVGVLIEIGSGKRPVEWCDEVLASRDRCVGGITAPASGLYLTGVKYPKEFNIDIPKSDIVLAS